MEVTAATRAEEASSLAVASKEAVLTEEASEEALEEATIEAALEEAVADLEAEIDTTNKMMIFLKNLTSTPNKSKLAQQCLQLNPAIVDTKVANLVAKITRNTVEAIIILLLIITMEADTIMAVANNLIIHLVVITNTNNELNKTTRQHT